MIDPKKKKRINDLWSRLSPHLAYKHRLECFSTTVGDLLELVIDEKDLLEIQEFAGLNKSESEKLAVAQRLIPEYIKLSDLFYRLSNKDTEKILEILDSPSFPEDILFKRRDANRKREDWLRDKKDKKKTHKKEVMKTTDEKSWDL